MDSQPTPPPAGGPGLELIQAESLSAEILNLPPSAPAPAPEPAGNQTGQPAAGAVRDSLGREFDPKRFRTDKASGQPFKNSAGHFMPKGGRPKGQTKSGFSREPVSIKTETPPAAEPARKTFLPPPPAATPAAPGETPQTAPNATGTPPPMRIPTDQVELQAEGYLRAGYLVADSVLDGKGEWQPDDKAEHESMKGAAVAYLQTNQGEPMPPGLAFAISVGVYAFKRVTRSNTAKTLRYFWGKITGHKAPAQVQPSEPARTAPAAPQPPTVGPSFEMPGL